MTDVMKRSLRIGVVPYMNGKPLAYGMSQIIPNSRLIEAVPSRLTPMLAKGKLDVAMIPVMGYLQLGHLEIIPRIGIASRGPVQSVRLFHRVPIRKVRRVLLDANSMTSAALTQIILCERYGLRPEFTSRQPSTRLNGINADAVLLIGDNAMQVRSKPWKSLDLGAEWEKLTGLPFVYAVWAAPEGGASLGLIRALNIAKTLGLAHRDEIAGSESRRLRLPLVGCRDYFYKHIYYDLGEAEMAGLKEFRRKAIAHGLLDNKATITIACG
jgi:chorismate dehydratase